MTESTTEPQQQTIQCTFCLHNNLVSAADALCNNCGIDLSRLLFSGKEPKPESPRPEIQPAPTEPLQSSKPKRKQKPRPRPLPQRKPERPATQSKAVVLPAPPLGDTDMGQRMLKAATATPDMVSSGGGDEKFEATVIMSSAVDATPESDATPAASAWLLEFEHDTSVVLPSDHVVLGRHPEETDTAMLIDVADPERRLSRTHARLRYDATSDTWTIEDMDSSNGVSVFDDETRTWRLLSPRHPEPATEYVAFGPLRARLSRRDTTPNSVATH